MLGNCVGESAEKEIEVNDTGVVLAISRHDESTSTVYAAKFNCEDNLILLNWDDEVGQIFQLRNQNDFFWDIDLITAEELDIGCLFTYKNDYDRIYIRRIDCKPLDANKIQMDFDFWERAFTGIKEAFPSAKKGHVSIAEVPSPNIAAIQMKTAYIENERIHFSTFQGEQINLKLLCRRNLTFATSRINLFLRADVENDSLADVALVKFETHENHIMHPTSSAVCVGLILRYKPLVISINDEPVQLKHYNGQWEDQSTESILFDTGNSSATCISKKLVEKLELEEDRSKLRKVVGIDGFTKDYSQVPIDIKVRGHCFKVNASVGALGSGTDLLIGMDIINPLLKKNYTLGE